MMKDLKPACLALMQRMDAWVLAKKKDLYEARTLYIKDVKELAARREELLKQLESVRNAETELSQTRERQDREQEEMEAVISELAQTKSARKAELDKLLSRIDSLSLEIAAKRRALEEKRREREIATQSLLPDLQVYQHLLAFDIVNQKPNLHRFVFTNIDQSSPRTEHWFELDSTNRAFRLTACKPSIPKADVMVEWLNSSRDLYSFIKAMRRAFVEHVNSRF
ncbi:kinetochore-associated Ndc80 complex subunit spc25 [Polyrhizophydium stewartii]|uniref:Kinetochore protein SPC25 n=1 Tax=Polyrhizophydium stewartii TaxID=2732419 RepID=A0ABR4N072_9FUNG